MFKSKRKKTVVIIIISMVILISIGIGVFLGVMNYKMNQIPKMSFEEMLHYTTENRDEATISVGIIQNGKKSYKVYGKNGEVMDDAQHSYEIGSITKTVTATLIYKAVEEGKLNIDDSIDNYLSLPQKDYYPTIKSLLTHTSGYKNYYFESVMISNFFHGRNDYYGISKEKLIKRIGKINLKDKEYGYSYSNFGFSVLGLVLAQVYGVEYTELANKFLQDELGLMNTAISQSKGDVGDFWDWKENDAYLSAGGLTSNITDMLEYAKLQLQSSLSYLTDTHIKLSDKSGNTKKNTSMNIHIDYMGAAWVGDDKNGIIWHNGGTGNYNSYIAFDIKNQIAVVILSNFAPSYRIPATVMGVKLMTELQSAARDNH